MVRKEILSAARVRRIPKQFSWVDQDLVRGGYARRVGAEALGLYLFLITVGDSQGLSYYSDGSIGAALSLDEARVGGLRKELIGADLIAYRKPLYQVLSLVRQPQRTVSAAAAASSSSSRTGDLLHVADVLRSLGKNI